MEINATHREALIPQHICRELFATNGHVTNITPLKPTVSPPNSLSRAHHLSQHEVNHDHMRASYSPTSILDAPWSSSSCYHHKGGDSDYGYIYSSREHSGGGYEDEEWASASQLCTSYDLHPTSPSVELRSSSMPLGPDLCERSSCLHGHQCHDICAISNFLPSYFQTAKNDNHGLLRQTHHQMIRCLNNSDCEVDLDQARHTEKQVEFLSTERIWSRGANQPSSGYGCFPRSNGSHFTSAGLRSPPPTSKYRDSISTNEADTCLDKVQIVRPACNVDFAAKRTSISGASPRGQMSPPPSFARSPRANRSTTWPEHSAGHYSSKPGHCSTSTEVCFGDMRAIWERRRQPLVRTPTAPPTYFPVTTASDPTSNKKYSPRHGWSPRSSPPSSLGLERSSSHGCTMPVDEYSHYHTAPTCSPKRLTSHKIHERRTNLAGPVSISSSTSSASINMSCSMSSSCNPAKPSMHCQPWAEVTTASTAASSCLKNARDRNRQAFEAQRQEDFLRIYNQECGSEEEEMVLRQKWQVAVVSLRALQEDLLDNGEENSEQGGKNVVGEKRLAVLGCRQGTPFRRTRDLFVTQELMNKN